MSTTDAGGTPETDAHMKLRREYGYTSPTKSFCESLETRLAALQKENAELRKDKERLDWLDKRRNWWAPKRHIDGYEQISRANIDSAMAAQQSSTPQTGNGGGA